MAREVIWSSAVEADIEEIGTYLEKVASESVATAVVTRIRVAAVKLTDFPYSARIVPEFNDPDRRENFVYEYRLIYRIEDDCVRILRVVHGRRLLKNIPGSFEEPGQEAYKAA